MTVLKNGKEKCENCAAFKHTLFTADPFIGFCAQSLASHYGHALHHTHPGCKFFLEKEKGGKK